MNENRLIVTRHRGAVLWLRRQGITGRVISHATANDVRGRHVVGNLPLHLAALTATITTIELPDLRPGQRAHELSPAEMQAAGARLQKYVVCRLDDD